MTYVSHFCNLHHRYTSFNTFLECLVFGANDAPPPSILWQGASPHVVILEPGDVLYVPRHWWHFVQNLETSISINTWLRLEEDHLERVREGVVRLLAMAIMNQPANEDLDWLNPTEVCMLCAWLSWLFLSVFFSYTFVFTKCCS